MIVLALDTTTRSGSAAVAHDGRVLHERSLDGPRTHAERLPADLQDVTRAAGLALSDVDMFAVAAGPGSFTGLRVGIATVQGLAMALERKVVPVSVLDALAHAAGDGAHAVAAWMDAQRGQVFASLYDAAGHPLGEPSALTPEATLAAWQTTAELSAVRFAGDGAMKYAEVLRARLGGVTIIPHPPLAGSIARIASANPARAVLPHAIVPIYIRRPDVELARERRRAVP